MNSFIKDLRYVFQSRFFVILSGVITSILTARYINPEGNGVLATLIAYPDIVVTIGALGVSHACTYLIGSKQYTIDEIVSSVIVIWIVSASICVSTCYILLEYFAQMKSEKYLILLAAFIIPFTLANNYTSGIFLGTGKIKEFNRINWIPDITRFIITFICLALLNKSVASALLAVFLGQFILFFFVLNKLNKTFKPSLVFKKNVIIKIVKTGILYAVSLFIINLNYKVGVVILEKMSSEYQVGIYTKGVSVVQYLWEVPTLMSTLIFSRSAMAKEPKEFSLKVCFLLRICSIVIFILGTIFYFISEDVMVIIYGEKFRDSASIQKILIPGVWLLTIFKVLNMDLVGKGKPLIALKSIIPALLINIILNIVLDSKYGGRGAAFASTISYTVGALLFLYNYSKATNLSILDIIKYRKEDFAKLSKSLKIG